MRNKAMVVAPWCLVAVLFFSGANEAPKPVPEYMKLLLLESQYQSACTLLAGNEIELAITPPSRDGLPDPDEMENLRYAAAVLELELEMAPLRKKYTLDCTSIESEKDDRKRMLHDIKKAIHDFESKPLFGE